MKLSLRWIFDHLKADWKKYSVDKLVSKFNATTAEIEGVEKVSLDLKQFALAQVVSANTKGVKVECPEWKKDFSLPAREDAQKGMLFMIKKTQKGAAWATVVEWGGIKEKLLPAFYCDKKDVAGGWKKSVETEDYIIEVDNKSITNRPDLWGHRGMAREISFLFDIPFLDEKKFLAKLPLKKTDKNYKASKDMPFSVSIEAKGCNRFSAMSIDDIEHRPSVAWMGARLCRVESSPIDLLVDATNYAMLDWGQPIHAFDGDYFKKKTIIPRMAKKGEKLTLLDDTKLTLTSQDIVVTDGEKPVALGGIKGGLKSGVSPKTKTLLIESANFDAETVRRTAGRHKVRTEASARFEKTPDPNQNVEGTMRFVQLLKDEKLPMKPSKVLVSVGKDAKPITVKITHDFIETRLGESIQKATIKKLLEKIGFAVTSSGSSYSIKVPTFRCSKDVTIAEDIVEEIGRLYGYEKIPAELPFMQVFPSVEGEFRKVRAIKDQLAFSAGMHEAQNYAFADQNLLKQLGWKTKGAVKLSNPLAEHTDTMVTSLIPHLLENVQNNVANNEELQFFEWARVWEQVKKNEVSEQRTLSGIFFKKSGGVDFYQGKRELERLFHTLEISVEWKKSTTKVQWAHAHQAADLYCGKTYLGTVGKVSLPLLKRVAPGEAFAFELNGDVLLNAASKQKHFVELPKYQATTLDVSVEVPLKVTVKELLDAVEKADSRIFAVELRDIFQKEDWKNKKSVTVRFSIRDDKKTLSREDIEKSTAVVQKALAKYGASVR